MPHTSLVNCLRYPRLRHPARAGCALAFALTFAACATAPATPNAPAKPAAPPWSKPTLGRTAVPAVYLEQWNRAANRATCAVVAPASLGAGADATPRAATFSGGWAVAYDTPGLRSAFGVAGTGSRATDETYAGWTNHRQWSDGSRADYGPEGGTGPNQLAYLRIAGEGCLYNVWSRLGREHLELLLSELRRVQ